MALENLEYEVEQVEEGRAFGAAGPYERLSGRAYFAVDPNAPGHDVITDLDLVPTGDDGRVRFSARFTILRATDPALRNRRAFLDLANRGGMRLLRNTNLTPPPPLMSNIDAIADGWLLQKGFNLVSCGWQHDISDKPGVLGASLPEALIDGERILGPIVCHLEVHQKTRTLPLSHMGHVAYEASDLDEATATLKTRDYLDGPATLVARERWSFASVNGDAIVPDSRHIHFEDGFEPDKLYELVYTAVGAVPTALGLVAVRDFLSHLRYASRDENNPCADEIDHVLGFGGSQPAGVLRLMDQLNLFYDERERPVLEGYIAHGAGVYLSEANWRFGQPSAVSPRTAGFSGPFDPTPAAGPNAVKAIYTISGPDAWDGFGALNHVELTGKKDRSLPENVRYFYLGGAPHVRGDVGDLVGARVVEHPINILDFGPFMRAAVINLDRWVREGRPFPASRVPTLKAGTLVERSVATEKATRATGVVGPAHAPTLGPLDFGPRTADHIIDHAPLMGPPYPALACDVDADGNDVDGLLHPEVSVPLATYLPWNIRGSGLGRVGQGATLLGSMLPFSVTGGASTDPRRAIADRYASRAQYLEKVRAAVGDLVIADLVLPEDEDVMLAAAAERWDDIWGRASQHGRTDGVSLD